MEYIFNVNYCQRRDAGGLTLSLYDMKNLQRKYKITDADKSLAVIITPSKNNGHIKGLFSQ